MLEGALGSPTFYKALNIYLTKNAYANADQNTLINAFEEVITKKIIFISILRLSTMNQFVEI